MAKNCKLYLVLFTLFLCGSSAQQDDITKFIQQLTSMLPQLTKARTEDIPALLNKTLSQLMKTLPDNMKNLNLEAFLPLVLPNMANKHSKIDVSKMVNIIQDSMVNPLKVSLAKCDVNPLNVTSLTFAKLMMKCINISSDLSLSKLMNMNIATLMNHATLGEIAKVLNLTIKDLTKFSPTTIVKLVNSAIVKKTGILHGPLQFATAVNNIKMDELLKMTLLDLGSMLSKISPQLLILNMTSTQRLLLNITINDLPSLVMKQLKLNVTLNAILTASFSDIVSALISNNQTTLQNSISKGILSITKMIPLVAINQYFGVAKTYMTNFNLTSLIKMIPGINNIDVKDYGTMTLAALVNKGELLLLNNTAVQKLLASSNSLKEMVPVAISTALSLMPKQFLNFIFKFRNASDVKSLGDMTVSDLIKYGPWMTNEVSSFLTKQNMSATNLDSIKLSTLLKAFNLTVSQLEKFTLTDILTTISKSALGSSSIQKVSGVVNNILSYVNNLTLTDLAKMIPGGNKAGKAMYLNTTFTQLMKTAEGAMLSNTFVRNMFGSNKNRMSQMLPSLVASAVYIMPPQVHRFLHMFQDPTAVKKLNTMSMQELMQYTTWTKKDVKPALKSLNISMATFHTMKVATILQALNLPVDKLPKLNIGEIASILTANSRAFTNFNELLKTTTAFMDKMKLRDLANYIPGVNKTDSGKVFHISIMKLIMMGEKSVFNSTVLQQLIGNSKKFEQLMPAAMTNAVKMIYNKYLAPLFKVGNVTSFKKLGDMNASQLLKLGPWLSKDVDIFLKKFNISLTNLDSIKVSSLMKALNVSWDKIDKMKITDITSMVVDLVFKTGSLKQLSQLFNVSKAFVDKTRIIDLVNYVPGMQKMDSSKLFAWTLLELVKIGETSFLNSSALHDAIKSSKTVEDLVPVASVTIAKVMYALQPHLNPIYNILKNTENLRKTVVGKIPLSDLMKVMRLNGSDVEKLLKIVQVPTSLFDLNKLTTLIKSLNSTMGRLDKANIMEIAALATKTAMDSARIFKTLESLNIGNAHSSMLQLIKTVDQMINASKVDLAKMIKLNFQQLIMKGETSLFNTSVLLNLLGSSLNANDLLPAVLAKMMSFIPKEYHRFLEIFKGINGAKSLTNVTLSDLVSPWNVEQFKKIMNSLKISTSIFDSTKLSQFLKTLNATVRQLENLSILRMAAAINNTASNLGPVIQKMQMQLSTMAVKNNVSLDRMLNKTIFQMLGLKPEQMRQLGLLDMLPRPISQDLLRLFNTTTIGQLEKSLSIILNTKGQFNRIYSSSILQLFLTAMSLDTSNVTAMVLKMLPIGKTSIAALLNTSEAFIMSQRYLTEFYPILKKAISSIVNKSSPFYYNNLFSRLLSMSEFQQFLGKTLFSQVEMIRKLIVKNAMELNAKAFAENAKKIIAAITAAMQSKLKTMHGMMQSPLDSMIKTCTVNSSSLSSTTLIKILLKCMDVSTDFPLSKLVNVNTVVLINEVTLQEMADMLGVTLKNMRSLSVSEIMKTAGQHIANRSKVMSMPLAYAAETNKMTMDDLMNMNVLDVGSRISRLPKKLVNKDINPSHQGSLMITMNKLRDDLMSPTGTNLTENAMSMLSINEIIKYLISKNQTYLKDSISKGLVFTAKEVQIRMISKMYKMNKAYMDRLKLTDVAYHISGKNQKDFANLMALDPLNMETINKASMYDCSVLLKLQGPPVDPKTGLPKTVNDMTLMQMKEFLIALPARTTLVLERIEDIAKSTKKLLQTMTLSDVQSFAPWSNNDVKKLLSAVNVPWKYFNEAKHIKFSILQKLMHTSVSHLGKFNVIGINAALCSDGKHYNGSTCISFKGCDAPSSASLCKSNSECDNMIGSYFCRCKLGFTGDGTNCYDACQKKSCPENAECFNVPDSGTVCRCSKPLHVIRNGKCVNLEAKIFKVAGTKFDQKFNPKYSDKSSKEFKNKAAELESVLYIAVCMKVRGCKLIQVTRIGKGSIVIDYNVLTDPSTPVTASAVQNATIQALDDPALAVFKPDKTSLPKAQTSDICQSGGDDCGVNSICNSNSDGSYTCNCKTGYAKKGNSCSEVSQANIVRIVVPVVVGVILLLVIAVIIYKRQRAKKIKNSLEMEPTFSYTKDGGLELENRGMVNYTYE